MHWGADFELRGIGPHDPLYGAASDITLFLYNPLPFLRVRCSSMTMYQVSTLVTVASTS